MKKKINISTIDSIILLGPNDQNIKLIEDTFNSKIVVRGDFIFIEGTKQEISLIELIIRDMLFTINQKGFIDLSDIKILINTSQNSNITQEKLHNTSLDNDNVILYTHKNVICARTVGQKKYLKTYKENDIIFAIGPAGTGKTYQAVALAVAALKSRQVEKIVITRPAVEAGESLGFLPGDLREKVDPYLTPIYDALKDMVQKNQLKDYLKNKTIEIAPLAYMRGRTLHNAFMILDEAQNATSVQMKMFLTRLGVTSQAIITGDITQVDLPKNEKSGLLDVIKIFKKIKGIGFVKFTEKDVVRHELVKKIILAYSKMEMKK